MHEHEKKPEMTLIVDGDDCLWKAPIDGYLFPRMIIAKYLSMREFKCPEKDPPKNYQARKVYEAVQPKKDSKIYKWLVELKKQKYGPRDMTPSKVFEDMLRSGTVGSRNTLMKEEGVYELFLDITERDTMQMLPSYNEYLLERGKQVREILELYDERCLYTSATRERALKTLTYMGINDLFDEMVTTEDNLPKSEPENFRKISKRMGHGVIFVDDCVAYVLAAQKAGLRAFHSSEYCSPLVQKLCDEEKLSCISSFSQLEPFAVSKDKSENKEKHKKRLFRKLKRKLFGN